MASRRMSRVAMTPSEQPCAGSWNASGGRVSCSVNRLARLGRLCASRRYPQTSSPLRSRWLPRIPGITTTRSPPAMRFIRPPWHVARKLSSNIPQGDGTDSEMCCRHYDGSGHGQTEAFGKRNNRSRRRRTPNSPVPVFTCRHGDEFSVFDGGRGGQHRTSVFPDDVGSAVGKPPGSHRPVVAHTQYQPEFTDQDHFPRPLRVSFELTDKSSVGQLPDPHRPVRATSERVGVSCF